MRHDDLIYDIGMDQCQDTDFYLAKGFRVVAVDANPAVCEMARERYAKQINSGQLTVLNRAISEASEPLVFHVCETLSMLSTADDYLRDREMSRNGHTFKDVTVEGLRPADLVGEYGVPYFAKIDIEGFDLVCLRGFEGFAEKPYYVSTEADLRAYHDQVDCLSGLGYNRFALVSQGGVGKQKPPRPAKIGRDIDHTFVTHSSGLFGPELPYEWVSRNELLDRFRDVMIQSKLTGALRATQLHRFKKTAPMMDSIRKRYLPLARDWYDIHAAV